MIIIGAGGFAKELSELFFQQQKTDLSFFDNINAAVPDYLFGKFPVMRTEESVKRYFAETDSEFCIGIGNPKLRKELSDQFIAWGGTLRSVISSRAYIGSYEISIGTGTAVLAGAAVSNCSQTGIGCILYYQAVLTHDCILGNFVQVSPAVNILGSVRIDDFVMIGANATILPGLHIGKHAYLAAGALITQSVPPHALMVGAPAKQTGWVNEYGDKLQFDKAGVAKCSRTSSKFFIENGSLIKAPAQLRPE